MGHLLLHNSWGACQAMPLQNTINASAAGEHSRGNALCCQCHSSTILTAQLLDKLSELNTKGWTVPFCCGCRTTCIKKATQVVSSGTACQDEHTWYNGHSHRRCTEVCIAHLLVERA